MASLRRVELLVSGFAVEDCSLDEWDLHETARAIASEIGMELASLGRSSHHGSVILTVEGVSASSEEPPESEADGG